MSRIILRRDLTPENNLDRKQTHTARFNGHSKCSKRREQTSILERGMANKKPAAIIVSRLSALKQRQVSGPPCNQPGLVDIDDLIQEDHWFQQVGEVYKNLSVQHPIYYDAYNLCDLHKSLKMI